MAPNIPIKMTSEIASVRYLRIICKVNDASLPNCIHFLRTDL